MAKPSPLSVLPLSSVLRNYLTTVISSSPMLLPPSLAVMTFLANSTRPWLNPDQNPVLRFALKKTFYAQFCAGENPVEVRKAISSLKSLGYRGVILGYAREVVMDDLETKALSASSASSALEVSEVDAWAKGTMETIQLTDSGDFVALKFTGAGRTALYALAQRLPPSDVLARAIDAMCRLAQERGVRLLFDAEQQAVQAGIDDWTLTYMRKYNKNSDGGKAVVYGTYQAYLKATPRVLSEHLATARLEGFTLGVKLVRGAYLGSDPRHLIHDTKSDTDAAYDGIAAALLRRRWTAPLVASPGGGEEHAALSISTSSSSSSPSSFPRVDLILASHNAETVRKAREILEGGEAPPDAEVAFGQLQGMADEVSCTLIRPSSSSSSAVSTSSSEKNDDAAPPAGFVPAAYKYLVWGSTGECMKYLLRRAQENRDAVQRTRSGREAMWGELVRRARGVFGRA